MELYKFFKMISLPASLGCITPSRVKILVDRRAFGTSCVRERRTRTGYPKVYSFALILRYFYNISKTLISVRRVLDVWTGFRTICYARLKASLERHLWKMFINKCGHVLSKSKTTAVATCFPPHAEFCVFCCRCYYSSRALHEHFWPYTVFHGNV